MTLMFKVFSKHYKNTVLGSRKTSVFSAKSVQYLGHVLDAEGSRPTDEKIAAIMTMKVPKNLQELRVLIGLVNYYAKFIPNQATLLSPWYKLLQKGVEFQWNAECEHALK